MYPHALIIDKGEESSKMFCGLHLSSEVQARSNRQG